VDLNTQVKVTFNMLMQSSSLNSDAIRLIPDQVQELWYTLSQMSLNSNFQPANVEENPVYTQAMVDHASFWDQGLGGALAELAEFVYKGITVAPFKPPEFEYPGAGSKEEPNVPPSLMQHISPGTQDMVKAIERNIAKKAFLSKIRVVTLAKKDENGKYDAVRFKEFRAKVNGFLSQFTSVDLNDFVYKRKVSAHYWFPETRKNYRKNQPSHNLRHQSLRYNKHRHRHLRWQGRQLPVRLRYTDHLNHPVKQRLRYR